MWVFIRRRLMRHAKWLFPVLALTFLGQSAFAADIAEPGWINNDLDKALAEARKTEKPIFVVFRCER